MALNTFTEAMIYGYELFEEGCGNDPGDHHILAAAIHGKTQTIITMNLKHFPVSALAPWEIFAIHPGTYLETLFEHDQAIVVDKLHRIAIDRNRTVEAVLSRLSWTIPTFSKLVSETLGLQIAQVTPVAWKMGNR